jgi:hypothetical protein
MLGSQTTNPWIPIKPWAFLGGVLALAFLQSHRYEKVELSPYNPTPMRELKSGAKSHEFDARLHWAKPESEDPVVTGTGHWNLGFKWWMNDIWTLRSR